MLNGKLNVVFGFIFFATTAVLGPAVLIPGKGELRPLKADAAAAVEKVRAGGSPEDTAAAVVATADYTAADAKVSSIGGTAHAHGNLESMLNIVAGFILISLCIPYNYKRVISVVLLLGVVCHSGMLYLGIVFGQSWAFKLTNFGAVCIVAGLLMMGGACIAGLGSECGDDAGGAGA